MSQVIFQRSRQFSAVSLILAAVILAFFTFADRSRSANPTSGNLGPAGPTATWVGTAVGGSAPDEAACVNGVNCDVYTLMLTGTPADWLGKKAHIKVSWSNGNDDFDVAIHKGTLSGPVVGGAAASGGGPEEVDLDPSDPTIGTGTFVIRVIYFTVAPTDQYNGEASVLTAAVPTPTPSPGSTPTPTPLPPGTPRFVNHVAPPGYGEDSGEPNIGSNWLTENVARAPGQMFANTFVNGTPNPIPNGGTANYFGGFSTDMLRATFDDCSSPATPFWEKKPLVLAGSPHAVGDPILSTISPLGRTFVVQEESAAGSTTDITDNDGDTFTPSSGGGPAGFDHETIVGGPYHGAPPPTATYPASGTKYAVYYAAQNVADAGVTRSDDGGVTFGPPVPMYTTADCGGLHGHIKVTPDTPATRANGQVGTVYVPNNACGGTDLLAHADGQQAAIVSEDNGLTWNIRKVPGSDTQSNRDPSIGIATDGTIYMGMQSKDGHARISVSHDQGRTWTTPYDVGAQLGIQNIVFPAVVAGDPNRAAFAFHGSTTPGDNYHCGEGEDCSPEPPFAGVWYLYLAVTYDGGATWTTTNLTPNDPVQRGGICNSTSATCRNLLDFFDATIDKEGRVVIGWADGCVGACVNGGPNSFTTKATITRQSGGKRMFAAFDPVEPGIPGAPAVTGSSTTNRVVLNWQAPDNGGSPITGYNVYRRVGQAGVFALLATTPNTTFVDSTANTSLENFYRVTAVNAIGESPYCKEFQPGNGVASACNLPGVLVIDDTANGGADSDSGQNTPPDGRVNIRQLFIAEPFVDPATDQFVFTMQVATSTLGGSPPNSQWMIIWNRQGADGGDANDAKYDRIYLAMVTDANGAPSFEYGKFGTPLPTDGSGVPTGVNNTPKKIGAADAGSYDPLTGLITIKLSKTKLRMIDGGAAKYVPGTDLAGINVRTYFNRPDYISDPNSPVQSQRSQNNASDITSDSTYTMSGSAICAPMPDLLSAVSRKIHGAAGPIDIRIYPTATAALTEPRMGTEGGSDGVYHVVFRFGAPVTFTGAVTDSMANVTSTTIDGNDVIVNLTGVPNQQTTHVTLNGVSAGGASGTVSVPLTVLIGDVNDDKTVNAADATETRNHSGELATDEEGIRNQRDDVNFDGVINSADATVVRNNSGKSVMGAQIGARRSR
ncbi:MAG: dockerin type I domain-containing protein [Chthoniobacterales bacterium]